MNPKDCNRFDSCSASICPLDGCGGIWYPDEHICTSDLFKNQEWIKNQKKIARKVRNKDFYFTKEMLERTFVVTVATEGLDPDKTEIDDEKVINEWLRKHPQKREISQVERENARERMLELKRSLTLLENSQKRQEFDSEKAPRDGEIHPNEVKPTQNTIEAHLGDISSNNHD